LELKARLKTGRRIIDLQRQLREQAERDGLTGLWNRKRMFRILEKEINRSQREGHPIAVLMIDIDEFKKINDTHGHQVGDLVLKAVADRLRKNLRSYDEICRYGGDEIFIVLPNGNLATIKSIAERLRRSVSQKNIKTDMGTLHVSISVGGATSETFFSDITPEALIVASDKALIQAKSQGRNRAVINR
ncbi:MAG: GGDEF domain-containing protein, partial [Candidatus Aminicenantales bacterium]